VLRVEKHGKTIPRKWLVRKYVNMKKVCLQRHQVTRLKLQRGNDTRCLSRTQTASLIREAEDFVSRYLARCSLSSRASSSAP